MGKQEGRRVERRRGREDHHYYAKPSPIQDPQLVLEQTKGHQGWQNRPSYANFLDNKLREDLERLKKIRAHRGLRHYWGLRTRGQHTKTTGRRGRTVGVSKKK